MELNKDVLDEISLTAANEDTISEPQFLNLIKDVFYSASGEAIRKENESKIAGSEQKIAFSSLFSLLLEAAKHDVNTSTLSSLLEECQMGPSRISAFIKLYQENKEKIQLQLALIGKNYNQIIDVDWRQDYRIKSSSCERISELSYIISLKTWNTQNNCEKDITFGCTLEQLQDLVLKLKDATKCIERNSV